MSRRALVWLHRDQHTLEDRSDVFIGDDDSFYFPHERNLNDLPRPNGCGASRDLLKRDNRGVDINTTYAYPRPVLLDRYRSNSVSSGLSKGNIHTCNQG